MEQKSNRIYAEMPAVRLFFHAALPGVISMFAMSVYSIIEGIFVGQFVGGDAFAGYAAGIDQLCVGGFGGCRFFCAHFYCTGTKG